MINGLEENIPTTNYTLFTKMERKETFIIRTEWWGAIQILDTEGKSQIFENLFHFHNGKRKPN